MADRDGLSAVYAVHDEGFEEDGAVVGYTGLLVDHSGVGECALVLLMRQEYGARLVRTEEGKEENA